MNPRQQYLLDTNVISETRKRQPHPGVVHFFSETDPSAVFISVLTIGELRKGVTLRRKSDPTSADTLAVWVAGLELSFAEQIVGIDLAAAQLWGEWSAQRPRSVIDTLLAATASVHQMTFVTRNTEDIADLPVQILNPWNAGP